MVLIGVGLVAVNYVGGDSLMVTGDRRTRCTREAVGYSIWRQIGVVIAQ